MRRCWTLTALCTWRRPLTQVGEHKLLICNCKDLFFFSLLILQTKRVMSSASNRCSAIICFLLTISFHFTVLLKAGGTSLKKKFQSGWLYYITDVSCGKDICVSYVKLVVYCLCTLQKISQSVSGLNTKGYYPIYHFKIYLNLIFL